MMATDPSETLSDELFDRHIEAVASARIRTPRENYISAKEMGAFVDKLFEGKRAPQRSETQNDKV